MKKLLIGLLVLGIFACKPNRYEERTDLWTNLEHGWNEIPGGDTTVCSNGTPYSFFFHPGNREKLVVFFQGGGACWNPTNCNLAAKPTYDPSVDTLDNPAFNSSGLGGYAWDGIFDLNHPENPFKEYSILLIPYCTADTHLGQKDETYSTADTSFVIHHQGYRNAMAALNWALERVSNPSQIFVTGASAGSIASPAYASILAKRMPRARIVHLGDSSGAYQDESSEDILDHWGTQEIMEAAGFQSSAASFNQMMISSARNHPRLFLSAYNSAFDEAQKFFLAQMGETPDSILAYIQANQKEIASIAPNYAFYLDTGRHHVILTRPQFYTTNGGGTPLKDWVARLVKEGKARSAYCSPCQ